MLELALIKKVGAILNRRLETERLILRQFTEEDITECFHNYGQDELLGKYLPMYPMNDIAQMESMIKGFVDASK